MGRADEADAPGADEFDCVDCGRHIVSLPPGSSRWTAGRSTTCFLLPGWFLIDELRVRLEPDEDWRPPNRASQGADPAGWRCEVPGCAARTPLMRVCGYDEPFRGVAPITSIPTSGGACAGSATERAAIEHAGERDDRAKHSVRRTGPDVRRRGRC